MDPNHVVESVPLVVWWEGGGTDAGPSSATAIRLTSNAHIHAVIRARAATAPPYATFTLRDAHSEYPHSK